MNPPAEMLAGLLVVSLLWGVTTPLMRHESLNEEKERKEKRGKKNDRQWPLLIHLLSRWRFLCVYLLNQTGSLAYYALLGSYDLMVISPLANGLAFVFTFLTESFLERRNPRTREMLGASLVVLGFALCLRARAED